MTGSVERFFALDSLLGDDIYLVASDTDVANGIKTTSGVHDATAIDDDVVTSVVS